MSISVKQFQKNVLDWYKENGRRDLPWQRNITPYRVWVSEIMLQQTQVAAVIPYFERFVKHFSNIHALTQAPLDDVLYLWSGLGYYARARNLHRCAKIIVENYQGVFPDNVIDLQALPGIGRSTAGAILSFGMNKYASILDGNIKRLLARYHAIEGAIDQHHVLKQLWQLSEQYTPLKQFVNYNQAMMDLGAMVCTKTSPKCDQCPLRQSCQALYQNRVEEFPYKRKRKILSIQKVNLLLLQNEGGELLLEKRPPMGIWGGLWSFPQCEVDSAWQEVCEQEYACIVESYDELPQFRHTFTHFHLDIHPILIHVKQKINRVMENSEVVWYNISQSLGKGVPKPIKHLLEIIKDDSNDILS